MINFTVMHLSFFHIMSLLLTCICCQAQTDRQGVPNHQASMWTTTGETYMIQRANAAIVFRRSTDGKTWPVEVKIAELPGTKPGDLSANDQPEMAVAAAGPFMGRIYVCWAAEKYGKRNTDVFLAYSDDKGDSWTEPILVTYRPNHLPQFKPSLWIDQETGDVYLCYYDMQNSPERRSADVYLAVSHNGGLQFNQRRISQPVNMDKPGEGDTYLEKNNNKLLAYWLEGSGQKSAWRSADVDSALATAVTEYLTVPKTFNFAATIYIDFNLKKAGEVYAYITKPLDPGFEKRVTNARRFSAGDHRITINMKKLGIKPGNYVITLYAGDENQFAWILTE
jgi:hypothetical protein